MTKYCSQCGKEITLRGEDSLFDTLEDGRIVCQACLDKQQKLLSQQQKDLAISTLYQGGTVTEYFRIPQVVASLESDDPKKQSIGHLIFTDKGICFAQVDSIYLTSPNDIYLSSTNESLGRTFGLVGALCDAVVLKAENRRKRSNSLEKLKQDESDIGPTSLRQTLDGASQVIIIPKAIIAEIKHKGNQLMIETSGKPKFFTLEGKKNETYQLYERRIRDYLTIPANNVFP